MLQREQEKTMKCDNIDKQPKPDFANATTQRALDISALLGQATPRPWRLLPDETAIYRVGLIADASGDCIAMMDSRGALAGKEEIIANAQVIVLAVNALPAFLKLREAAAAIMVECAIDTPPSLGAIANLDAAVVKVDTALGLSPE